ncbi:MAG: cyclic nucleotide-binding domain-containing protein [Tatlockia sp.]|nr:cyclic nucleotide-binding domain-containing protein [Tatlockia sp.]
MGITLAFLISQIILLISYLMTSMIFLRAFVCLAQLGFMVAALMFGLDQPGMLPTFLFAILIFGINVIHIYRLIYARLPATIPVEFTNAYQKAFHKFTPREFVTLMRFAENRFITDGFIIQENTKANVCLILEGRVSIIVESKKITELGGNDIIGEISYLTGTTSIASVQAIKTVNYYFWSKEKLSKLKKKYPKVYFKFYEHLLECISSKLRKQNIRALL